MKAYRQAYSEGYSNGYHDGEEEAMDNLLGTLRQTIALAQAAAAEAEPRWWPPKEACLPPGYSPGDRPEWARDVPVEISCPHAPTYDGPNRVACSCGEDYPTIDQFWEHVRDSFYYEEECREKDASVIMREALRQVIATTQAAIARITPVARPTLGHPSRSQRGG